MRRKYLSLLVVTLVVLLGVLAGGALKGNSDILIKWAQGLFTPDVLPPPANQSPPVVLTPQTSRAILPQLTQIAKVDGGQEKLVAAWLEWGQQNRVVKWSPLGVDFKPETSPGIVINYDRYPLGLALKSDSQGRLHLAVGTKHGETRRALYSRKTLGGQTGWAEPENISVGENPVYWPNLALDNTGAPHLAWHVASGHNAGIFYRNKVGGVWNDGEVVTPKTKFATFWRPSLGIDPDGNPHIAYFRVGKEGSAIMFTSRIGVNKWKPAVKVSEELPNPVTPKIIVDGQGMKHIFWLSGEGTVREVYYAWGDGEEWHSAERISQYRYLSDDPVATLGPRGELHVAWSASLGKGKRMVYYRKGMKSDWSDTKRLSGGQGNVITPMVMPSRETKDRLEVVWVRRISKDDMKVEWATINP